ncbi:gamma-glutamyltransferase [Thermoleophilia bacterium SCSIO 60948]|nr:gamma-glutamyltransferase [Thermoleophilia bacterium SCSIO 60948]
MGREGRGGVVAAGHRLTAEAGARAFAEGGNAVDAALAAVMASFACESPLTALGAGGHMLVHGFGDDVALDFFVEVPGRDAGERAELVEAEIWFNERVPQTFHVGAASCAVPGVPAGLAHAASRWASLPFGVLAEPAVELASRGVEMTAEQAYFHEILDPILSLEAEGAASYSPAGRPLLAGERLAMPDLADGLRLLAAEGAEPFYRGETARRIVDFVAERGGIIGAADLAAYRPVEREPVRVAFAGRELVTNPPPSSGGVLIALALAALERADRRDVESIVRAMAAIQALRDADFAARLAVPGFADELLADDHIARITASAEAAGPLPGSAPGGRLGSTTHVTAVDVAGRCASVTCSNGSSSGIVVPGTGVHLNNMLGEQDLNPLGFHRFEPGVRMPSMMSPSVVLGPGGLELGLGSGGSNRIRSAILQVVLRATRESMPLEAAIAAPRVHFENGEVQAEPGADPAALAALEASGATVERWDAPNVFFGGVHAVARDGEGRLEGAGDPRRGGAVAAAGS